MGEAIIDMIPDQAGSYRACPGGSLFNVARALGLQSVPTCYLSPFSQDGFGTLLSEQIQLDGVYLDVDFTVDRPSSMAVISLDEKGVPSYSLYREGIADREYSVGDVVDRLPADLQVFHTGSLAIIPDDVGKVMEIFTELRARGVLISVDLNVRPNVCRDNRAYVAGLKSLIPFCDILKASDEDLRYMGLDDNLDSTISEFLQLKQGGLVAITAGDKGAYLGNRENRVQRQAFPVSHLEDTVGAGDCFQAGMLAALFSRGLLTREKIAAAVSAELVEVLNMACATAAINVGRKGCNPPTGDEIMVFLDSVATG